MHGGRLLLAATEFRFLLANLLIPQLQSAEGKGEDARVMTVFAAGKQGSLDPDDLGLKKGAGLKRNADATTAYNDLMVEVTASLVIR